MITFKWTPEAIKQLEYWKENDKSKIKRIQLLINVIEHNPFIGIGKPEPLKHGMSGLWSRRIDNKNRLVYSVHSNVVIIHQCRYHY